MHGGFEQKTKVHVMDKKKTVNHSHAAHQQWLKYRAQNSIEFARLFFFLLNLLLLLISSKVSFDEKINAIISFWQRGDFPF